jgi:hypothetical protein
MTHLGIEPSHGRESGSPEVRAASCSIAASTTCHDGGATSLCRKRYLHPPVGIHCESPSSGLGGPIEDSRGTSLAVEFRRSKAKYK